MGRGSRTNPLGKIGATARATCLCCAAKTPFSFVGMALSTVPSGVAPENVQAWLFALYSGAAQYLEKRAKDGREIEDLNASSFADAVLCVSWSPSSLCNWTTSNMLYAAVLPADEGYSTAFHCEACFARRFRDDILKPLLAVRVARTVPDVVLTLWAYRTAYLKKAAESVAVEHADTGGAFTF